MRTHAKWIWIVVFVAFVGGFLLYEVSGLAGRSGPTTSTVVASVNGRDIGYIQWVNASQQLAQQQEQQQTRGLTLDERRQIDNQAFHQLVMDVFKYFANRLFFILSNHRAMLQTTKKRS